MVYQKQPPAFQFYVDDYLSSSHVTKMNLEEQGAYIRLLLFCWKDGSIPVEFSKLAKLCNTTARKINQLWPQLSECFVPADMEGRLINEKLESVRRQQLAYREERSASGKRGAVARWLSHDSQDGSAMILPLAKNGTPTPTPTPSRPVHSSSPIHTPPPTVLVEFEQFWIAYPKKKSKGQARKVWLKLKPANGACEQILNAIAKQKESVDWLKDNGQFIPYPATWLSAEGWLDQPATLETQTQRIARLVHAKQNGTL